MYLDLGTYLIAEGTPLELWSVWRRRHQTRSQTSHYRRQAPTRLPQCR
ncbi:hypothetical protein [Streptomyces purpurascens]|uniref:Uncharacterized protein n=1 Tax=Streptomyces purpurascens TaxID=1924 RepID=A0ABZ1MFS9_STREF|nr:hypothetical protein [Streptomyces purpurascens]MCE7047830.1 hypothetical protein [Streptomyces purpurascens]